jgi:curved DNA-binding protein CbpA
VDTFELLPTLAQGELAQTSAPELVAAVFRSRASGTLCIETPDGKELTVYFRAGDMCGAAPSSSFHTLAHVLLANDWVSALDIDETREESAATGKRHGEVLVAKGILSPEQLHAALQAQHAGNLSALLSVTAGRYEWRGWEPPPPWARDVAGPGMGLVAALESVQHAARREKVLSWLGTASVQLSADWEDLQERLALDAASRGAAAALSEPRAPADFVQSSGWAQARGEALLAVLLLLGAADAREVSPVPMAKEPAARSREPAARIVSAPEPAARIVSAPEPAARIVSPPEPAARIVPRDPDLLDLEPLSDEPIEPEEEVLTPFPEPQLQDDDAPLELDFDRKAASHGVRDEPQQEAEPQPPEVSQGSDENAARELRKRMMARGLRNLGGGPSHAPQPESAPTARAPSGAMTDAERVFAAEVAGRLQRAPAQTAYARLGVAPNATLDAIKGAYLSAAKQFHPDRASGGLASLESDLRQLFNLLKDAYDTIGTREARERYDKAQRAESTGGSRREESATSVKMGEVLLKKRDFEGAIGKLRKAVELDGNGDALAALAWALVADPKASNATKEEAATLINKALRAEGATARTYYVAGVLWRTKDPDSAMDAFKKTLELDPNHADAALELRLIEQRRGKQKGSGGVLSGLLFGKRKG